MKRQGFIWLKDGKTYVFPSIALGMEQRLDELGSAIDPSQAEDWGLKFGDEVIFDEKDLKISSVNDAVNPKDSRNRRDFMRDIVDGILLGFAAEEIPIDSTGDLSLCVLRALAPFGRGGDFRITGRSKTGKSWLMRALTEALLALACPNDAFVVLDVGERVPDVGTRRRILEAAVANPTDLPRRGVLQAKNPRIEHYFGFTPELAVRSAQFALQRVHRLVELGYDVYFLVDSLWGLIVQLSMVLEGGAFAGKGVSRDAMNEARRFLFAGNIPNDGSLTLAVTSLHEGDDSGSGVVHKELGGQTATGEWRTRVGKLGDPWPRLDLGETTARELEALLGGEDSSRYQLHVALSEFLTTLKAHEALAWVRSLFEEKSVFDPNLIWDRLAEEKKKYHKKDVLGAHQMLVDAAAKLKDKATEAEKVGALVAAGLVMEVPWDQLAEAAYARVPAEPEVDPHPELPPPEEYVALSERLRAEGVTDKSFRTSTARRLRNAGVTLEQLEEHLRGGGKPSDLHK